MTEDEKIRNEKVRILHVLALLHRETDEDHALTNTEIVERLRNMGIAAERRTIQADVNALISYGYDIQVNKTFHYKYRMLSREFQIPELRMLIDAVASSRAISLELSRELIDKIAGQASKYQAEHLTIGLDMLNAIKSTNGKILYVVNDINTAIAGKKQLSFQYTEYNADLQKVLRNEGEIYCCSPYKLLENEERYYICAWSEKHRKVIPYRVDRMCNTKVLELDAVPQPENFNVNEMNWKQFKMFGGEEQTVVLECENSLAKAIVDRFGEDVPTKKSADGKTFQVELELEVSRVFYSWVFQYGEKMRIVGPEKVREEYRKCLWGEVRKY